MSDKSWGILGKPPRSVMNGTSDKMALFKHYQSEAAKAQKMANKRLKAVKIAELKVNYARDFPPEDIDG